jgi:hypothetical protein
VTAEPSSQPSKSVLAATSVESSPDGTVEQLLQLELGRESELPGAIVAFIGRMIEQQQAERETFLAALRVYKEETARLTLEVSEARAELGKQIEASRAEREHLIGEFLDRVDQLSAKVSTSTARFNAKLDEKDAIIQDKDHRVEAYAGIAANAQNVIEDMRRSTSWRLTIPVRVASRLLARRGTSAR